MQTDSTGNGEQIRSREEIQTWLVNQVAGLLFVDPKTIDVHATFNSFGLSSRDAVMLSGDLEEWMDRRFSPTLVYEYPTISDLVDYLSSDTQDATGGIRNDVNAVPAASQKIPEKFPSQVEMIESLEQLSDDEAEALLLQKIGGFSQVSPTDSDG